MSVDLRAKPFYLDDKGVEWVEKTFASLSDREKVGQLFCEILWDRPGSSPEALFDFIEPGAVMYRPFPGHKMWEFSNRVQKAAKVPLLVACNLERGGKGFLRFFEKNGTGINGRLRRKLYGPEFLKIR